MTDKPVVAFVNASTVWPDDRMAALLPALQIHVTRDLATAWGLAGADLIFMKDRTAKLPPGAWVMALLDDSDQAGALGYHDVTSAGLPMGKCFLKTDLEYGENGEVTICHELDEMLCDPHCNSLALANFQGHMVFTLKEACDAVEADDLGYDILGHQMSDFVMPAFFQTFAAHPAGTKFDFCGHLSAPMMIAKGGYLSILNQQDGQGWHQVFGQHVPLHKRVPPRGSRRERFLLRAKHQRPWQRSTAV